MALIDELKQRRETATRTLAQIEQRIADEKNSVARVTEGIADLDRAITALEAPAQPLDELRSVPGAEEESRDHLIDAQTSEEVDPRVSWKAEPEIPEGFIRWEEGMSPPPADAICEIMLAFRDGSGSYITRYQIAGNFFGPNNYDKSKLDRIIAYRIIEAPASEQDDGESEEAYEREMADFADEEDDPASIVSSLKGGPEPEQPASVEIEPTTDLWQQGYNDKLNGYEPSLAEPEYTKGYEARALIEREQASTMEQAKFFGQGMMADADRHQSDQRGIVGVLTGMFKREREDA